MTDGQLSRTDFNNARDIMLAEAGQSAAPSPSYSGAGHYATNAGNQYAPAASLSGHRIPGGYDANGEYKPATIVPSGARTFGRAGLAGQNSGFGGGTTVYASPIEQSPRHSGMDHDDYRDSRRYDDYETPPSLFHTMVQPLMRFGDFSGRSSRREYWSFYLLHIMVGMFVGMMLVISAPIAMVIGLLYLMATFIPNLSVSVRRLHDQDKSGWFYLLSFIPLVGPLVLIVMLLSPGTRGPNRYGEVPA